MKIGIEAQRIFRKQKHGMDIVALELIRNLQILDQENEYVIFAKPDADRGVLQDSSNFSVIEIAGGPYPYWEQILLPTEVKKHGVELLHCTSNTGPWKISIPLVLTLHDIIYLEQWNFTRGTWYQIVGNLYRRWNVPSVVNKAARIITVSDFEHDRIQKHFGLDPGKLKTVYNGVGTQFRKVTDEHSLIAVRGRYSLPENFVFFLGNTDPKKNVEGVLKALSVLKREKKLDFKLVMPDIDRGYITQIAARTGSEDILNSILVTGYIPNDELPAIYSMAKSFIYPSLRESFGIPILEAMACGTPVVTSNTSSMPEVAGDAALLVDPRNPEELAQAIHRIMNDDVLRKQLVEKGKVRSAGFSWKQNALQTLELYKSVLSPQSTETLSKTNIQVSNT